MKGNWNFKTWKYDQEKRETAKTLVGRKWQKSTTTKKLKNKHCKKNHTSRRTNKISTMTRMNHQQVCENTQK